jgi:hypothetical protein
LVHSTLSIHWQNPKAEREWVVFQMQMFLFARTASDEAPSWASSLAVLHYTIQLLGLDEGFYRLHNVVRADASLFQQFRGGAGAGHALDRQLDDLGHGAITLGEDLGHGIA